MPVLGSLAPRIFIERHWQKEPLLVRGALAEPTGLVDGDTLAGLACETGVASRLVLLDAGTESWSCEDGPFDETRFAALPTAGWTLLVQAVDQWLPGVAALLAHFDFLPRWRLDDVMVSYASDGGGVGPHFDHYDVFLLQLEGARRWQVGQRCDAHTPLRDHPSLKLLEEFDAREDQVLEAGDMLYLPGGVAHRGTALGDGCITASIGFRAPSHAEIVQAAVDSWLAEFAEHQRYVDAPGSIDADPFLINETALAGVRALGRSAGMGVVEHLATAFGRLVTEPRDPTLIEPQGAPDAHGIRRRLAQAAALAHHPSSRFAYQVTGNQATLFVDGDAWCTSASVARGICHGRLEAGDLARDGTRELVLQLILAGSLELGS